LWRLISKKLKEENKNKNDTNKENKNEDNNNNNNNKKVDIKKLMIDKLETIIINYGLKVYFESLEINMLHKIAKEMEVESAKNRTGSKNILIASIIGGQMVKPGVKKGMNEEAMANVKISKHKPKLKKGVDYWNIQNHYTVAELIEFAKKKKIMTGGKKKELIERIIKWLEGDKKTTVAKKNNRKGKRARKNKKKKRRRRRK